MARQRGLLKHVIQLGLIESFFKCFEDQERLLNVLAFKTAANSCFFNKRHTV